ncbi:MAG: HGxxPAAW family protein [Sporichthyaceae bacterium]
MTEGHGANGRPMSWVSVLVICVGFTIGGLALCMDPTWWLFWTGVAITAVGLVLASVVNIMADYTTEDH